MTFKNYTNLCHHSQSWYSGINSVANDNHKGDYYITITMTTKCFSCHAQQTQCGCVGVCAAKEHLVFSDLSTTSKRPSQTNLQQHWLRKMQDCESRGDFHGYTQQPSTAALIHLSMTSCPPVTYCRYVIDKQLITRAAGLIALTRRLTRLSINRVKIFNRALIVNFSASHFSL